MNNIEHALKPKKKKKKKKKKKRKRKAQIKSIKCQVSFDFHQVFNTSVIRIIMEE
jgi:hypothetical protein